MPVLARPLRGPIEPTVFLARRLQEAEARLMDDARRALPHDTGRADRLYAAARQAYELASALRRRDAPERDREAAAGFLAQWEPRPPAQARPSG